MKKLMREAKEFAEQIQAETANLKAELAEAQKRARDIQTKLDSANLAADRLASFQSEIDGDLQCPRCWIYDGTRSGLVAIPSDTDEDFFRCRSCGLEY